MDSRSFSLARTGYVKNPDIVCLPPFQNARGVPALEQVHHKEWFMKPPGQFQGEGSPPDWWTPGQDERPVRIFYIHPGSQAVVR